eukprot:TRINITY_DN8595_c0_g1_i1.p1 TRINITY_DN8595_c0_g1~~TRINITY_DN8595_c0_g1_i1.p1  ORF type:complete len:1176 (+),score=463.09 TRINITY_DN8595_c0_g1_i1:143-3670(+)
MVWSRVEPRGLKITNVPVVFTPDSKHFFCCTSSTVNVFSTATGEQVRQLTGHASAVTSIFVNPINADQVYSSSLDGTIRLWNYVDSSQVSQYNIGRGIEQMIVDPRDPHRVFVSLTDAPSTEPGGKPQANDPNINKRKTVHLELTKVHSGRQLPLFKSGPVTGLAASRSGEFVAATSGHRLYVYNVATREKRSFTARKPMTAVAVHPTEGFVATGDQTGSITIWYCLGAHWHDSKPAPDIAKTAKKYKTWTRQRIADQKVTTKVMHWHANAITCLNFTNDAAYLLSGGQEAVLVVWQLETGAKQFLPRLGAGIVGVTPSPDSSVYAVSTLDNTVKLISTLSFKQQTTVRGFLRWQFKEIQGSLLFDPVQQLLVLNRRPGSLQWYNPLTDRYVRELEVTPVTQVTDRRVAQYVVDTFCMAFDASSLVTLDSRKRYESDHEYERNLKFWSYDSGTQQYVLNTRVDDPHEARVTSLAYHPSRHLVVSTSRDSRFKLWHRIDNERPATPGGPIVKEHAWVCRSVGSYKGLRAKHSAFSADGSLLAVAFGEVITLWNPATNVLLRELVAYPPTSEIRRVAFVPKSGYLVASSRERLYVWDLLTCTVYWSVALDVKEIAVDPEGGRFLVSTRPSDPRAGKKAAKADYLLLFETGSPSPKHSWRLDSPAVLIAFVPPAVLAKSQSRSTSTIFYLTSLQEVFLLEEHKADLDLEATPAVAAPLQSLEAESRAFEDLYSKLSVADAGPTRTAPGSKQHTKAAAPVAEVASSTPDGAIDALFSAPSHVLPPVSTLYRAFMDLLVAKEPRTPAAAQPDPAAAAAPMEVEVPRAPHRAALLPADEQATVWTPQSPAYLNMVDFIRNGFVAPPPGSASSAATTKSSKKAAADAASPKTPKKSAGTVPQEPASSPAATPASSGKTKKPKTPKTPAADSAEASASEPPKAPKTPKAAQPEAAAPASTPKISKSAVPPAIPEPKTPVAASSEAVPPASAAKSARKDRRKSAAFERADEAAAAPSDASPMDVDTQPTAEPDAEPGVRTRKAAKSRKSLKGEEALADSPMDGAVVESADGSADPPNGQPTPSAKKSRRKSVAVAPPADDDSAETPEPTEAAANGTRSHRSHQKSALDAVNGGHETPSRSKAHKANGDAFAEEADASAKRPRSDTPAKQSMRKTRSQKSAGDDA